VLAVVVVVVVVVVGVVAVVVVGVDDFFVGDVGVLVVGVGVVVSVVLADAVVLVWYPISRLHLGERWHNRLQQTPCTKSL